MGSFLAQLCKQNKTGNVSKTRCSRVVTDVLYNLKDQKILFYAILDGPFTFYTSIITV